jgi:hypothetical protein
MANKQNFTPEEWAKVLEGTIVAGMVVSAADPSGLWGTLKEAFASRSALDAAKLDSSSNELVKAVILVFDAEGRSPFRASASTTGTKPSEFIGARSRICGRSRTVDTKAR